MSDLKQAVETLRRQLRFFRIGVDVDFHSMILGLSLPFIKLYRHLLCEYDNRVSLFLSSNNFLLSETEDHRFMESLYRICRDVFSMKPPLSLAQFLTDSFAGKKLKMAAEVVKAVGELQKDLCRKTPKKRSVPTMVCASSVGPGGFHQTTTSSCPSLMASMAPQLTSCSSSQLASHKACRDDTCRVTRDVNTICPHPSQQNQPFPTQRSRRLILPQHTDTNSPPTADAKSLCSNDTSGPDHPHRSNRGSSPGFAKDSLDSVKNDYLSGLLTNLNTISNQLSQIVDRVVGIESRVCAIEQPMWKAATNRASLFLDKAKSKAGDTHNSFNGERAGSSDTAGLSPDLANRSDQVNLVKEATRRPFLNASNPTTGRQSVYRKNCYPQDQSSLSETKALAEINVPLLSSEPSIGTSIATSGECKFQGISSGRYSTFDQTFEQDASLCNAGASNALLRPFTRPIYSETPPQSLTTTALHELNSPSSVFEVTKSKSSAHRPFSTMTHIEPGDPGRGDELIVLPKQPTVRFTSEKDGLADQELKRQANRILNMLTETQDLLNIRRPTSTK